MSLQQICRTYQQNIQHTHAQSDATAELSLHPHLKTFLEKTAEFLGNEVTIMSEPRTLEIGRPDFVVKSGLLPVGYVEAEAYDRDLDALTGHAQTQNERFIENLDNFILTNFVEFRLYAEGQLRTSARITDESTAPLENFARSVSERRSGANWEPQKSLPNTSHDVLANSKRKSQRRSPMKIVVSTGCSPHLRNCS